MSESAYTSAGVDYDALDAGKRDALSLALTTSSLLTAHGARARDSSRGEPAFVFELAGRAFCFVLEGLGTKSVIARQVLSPLDIERVYGLTGGNIFQGEMALNQLFFLRPVVGWAGYKTPIKGLYLCGAAAHPGGGVIGAAGWNAARVILGKE